MAILHQVTVRLVSKVSKDGPREFIKPDVSSSCMDSSVERYIEAWPGMDFHIEVYFSREFNSEIGWGVMVGIKIDGGASYGYHWTKSQINRYQMSGSPIVFDGIEQSPTTRMAFRFGRMDENIDWALGEAESQVPELSSIEVEVVRVKLKRATLPSEKSPRTVATSPRTAVDLSGTQIQDDNFSNALWRKKRSAAPLLDSSGYIYEQDASVDFGRLSFMYRHGLAYQLQDLGCVPTQAEAMNDSTTTTGPSNHTSRDFKMLADKVDGLEKQLKESQEQTAALMQSLIGGVHSTIKAALEGQRTGVMPRISTPPRQASGLQLCFWRPIETELCNYVFILVQSFIMVFARSISRLSRPAASLLSSRLPAAAHPLAAPVPACFDGVRTLTATASLQSKVLLVLYDGKEHAREVPELLGTTENELGIRKWLEDQGHTLVTTSDKEGENSTFDKELVDAEVIITTPFHPGYLTPERLAKAKNLKLAVTAGIGSDHVDLDAANKTNGGIIVAEVTGSNVVSVAEHVVMTILVLVRNFVPAHEQVASGDWNVAAVAKGEYDLENKVVGTVAVGRIGERVLRRLKAFDCKELLYFDYQPLKPELEKEIGCRRVEDLEEMLAQCDIVTINCPLHEKTRGMFNKELISKMKKGSWLVNTARGAIVVKEDVAEALKSGHLRGYGGDVWFPQPAPKEHPLRYATNTQGGGNATVPHMSGTSLDAQKRYAEGTKNILQSYFSGKHDYRPEDLIVKDGDYATKAYGQRAATKPGNKPE
ncbi:MAG: hypothetical protein L6R40_002888 [Gallowayella cf. fulva]|nr:MAG: hypothetical protein L6R40_002888 [Xanthomendoza cf. fulva]